MAKINKNIENTSQLTEDIWGQYVPITVVGKAKTGKTYDIYLTESIEAPHVYSRLVHVLNTATKKDKVNLIINNGGGFVDSSFMIIDAMKRSKAHITSHLSGTVASAATIIALQSDDLVVSENLGWLSHNYSSGIQGKGAELKSHMDFMSKELASSFTKIHKGFLTDSEIKEVINDKDFWLNKGEVEKRWKRMQKLRGK